MVNPQELEAAARAQREHERVQTIMRDAIETAELKRRQAWLEDNGYRCYLEDVLENLKHEVGYGRDMSREWRRQRTAA